MFFCLFYVGAREGEAGLDATRPGNLPSSFRRFLVVLVLSCSSVAVFFFFVELCWGPIFFTHVLLEEEARSLSKSDVYYLFIHMCVCFTNTRKGVGRGLSWRFIPTRVVFPVPRKREYPSAAVNRVGASCVPSGQPMVFVLHILTPSPFLLFSLNLSVSPAPRILRQRTYLPPLPSPPPVSQRYAAYKNTKSKIGNLRRTEMLNQGRIDHRQVLKEQKLAARKAKGYDK